MQASIVIPTCGKWSRLRPTLTALANQRIPVGMRWEVFLVCDGVEPPEELRSLFDKLPLQVIRLPEARGRGAARNAGITAARGETIILLDDDVVVTADFIVAHLEAQATRPTLCHGPLKELPCLVGIDDLDLMTTTPDVMSERAETRIREVAQRALNELGDVGACATRYGSSSRLEADGMDAFKKGRRHVSWVAFAGANLSAPRKWFLASPMDERTETRWGLEDIALALRWSRNHRPLGVAEGALGLHLSHHRKDWRRNLHQNAICLDFLPERLTGAVLDYLDSKLTIMELESAFVLEEAGVDQPGMALA
jgi:glycosyltransferase involved in cell wall biosynthesis